MSSLGITISRHTAYLCSLKRMCQLKFLAFWKSEDMNSKKKRYQNWKILIFYTLIIWVRISTQIYIFINITLEEKEKMESWKKFYLLLYNPYLQYYTLLYYYYHTWLLYYFYIFLHYTHSIYFFYLLISWKWTYKSAVY